MSGARRPWLAALLRPRGNAMWDSAIRGSAALAVVGIVLLLYAGSAVAGIVGLVVVTIWVNGPLGLFLPATYEPIVMAFGRVYPPVVVALAGILGTVYAEFFNYHLYARVLQTRQLSALRAHPLVSRILPLFRRAPFFTVWLCSWSPLPHWSVRILAPLSGYPVGRFLAATFLGRFPRLWFFAALGALPIPRRLVLPVVAVSVVVALTLFLARPLGIVLSRAWGAVTWVRG